MANRIHYSPALEPNGPHLDVIQFLHFQRLNVIPDKRPGLLKLRYKHK